VQQANDSKPEDRPDAFHGAARPGSAATIHAQGTAMNTLSAHAETNPHAFSQEASDAIYHATFAPAHTLA
jgi:hypothetical protein